MCIKYQIFKSIPKNEEITVGIVELHKNIFSTSENLINKISSKEKLIVIIALDGKKVIGYKIGYELDNNKFYSWLGGVETNYRKNGIATELMKKQHKFLKESGYSVVQTKTMNKWRGMLVLNIKCGFDIMDTYIDEKGFHKIILEKNLIN
ncbi:GNAT family N-acetyltransferase [Evansella clarkii]|uniref:GNAT family N-acetyltransferase n=1 Tax=Evansella clarkii TaxID=79879 RepID=UPI0030B80A00